MGRKLSDACHFEFKSDRVESIYGAVYRGGVSKVERKEGWIGGGKGGYVRVRVGVRRRVTHGVEHRRGWRPADLSLGRII